MNKRDKNYLINILLLLLLCLIITFVYQNVDIISFNVTIKWYLRLVLFTVVGLPISYRVFNKFYDRGYIFSKILGFLIPGYIMFILASLHLFKFTYVNSLLCLIIFGIISYICLITFKIRKKSINDFIGDIKDKLMVFYRIEVIFFIIFLLVSYIKGFNPAASGTEKYMDYGFLAILNNSSYFPAKDMWLAGENINYYYFGHYILTYITKLTKVGVNYGYNLSLITLYTLTLFSAFVLGFNLVKSNSDKKYLPYLGGIISSLAVNVIGNFHYVIFNFIYPLINTIFHLPIEYYDCWSSTRYIGYNPDTVDKVIHEFPSFSYILGDLHSHLIDIFIVLLLLGILLAYLFNDSNSIKLKASTKGLVNVFSILIGLILGIMKMTNFWDYPIYLVVVILFFFFYYLRKYETIKDVFLMLLYQIILIFSLSKVFTLLFDISFIKIASKIAISPYHTLFYQLLVLWGIPTFMVIYYFLFTIEINMPIKLNRLFIKNYVSKLKISDYFILIIGFSSIGLILSSELVYVVDIFHDSMPRFNTVFKFTYQSFIMFGICYGYIIAILYGSSVNRNKVFAKILMVLLGLMCCYSYTDTEQWFGDITDNNNYKTLNAMAFLENEVLNDTEYRSIDNLEIINYLNKHNSEDDVIIEAKGDSYTTDNQISTFTGIPTVLGWSMHEWLWRSKNSNFDYPEILSERETDIDTFYHSTDKEELMGIINKYKIKYIVIGYIERNKYGNLTKLDNEDLLLSLGKVVVSSNKNNGEDKTYLIQVY